MYSIESIFVCELKLMTENLSFKNLEYAVKTLPLNKLYLWKLICKIQNTNPDKQLEIYRENAK